MATEMVTCFTLVSSEIYPDTEVFFAEDTLREYIKHDVLRDWGDEDQTESDDPVIIDYSGKEIPYTFGALMDAFLDYTSKVVLRQKDGLDHICVIQRHEVSREVAENI